MKRIIAAIFALTIASSLHAQDFPGCSDLRVEKVSLTDSGYIAVEMSNACVDCYAGSEGCTYAEMIIFDRDNALDTIAASRCFCLQAPPNEGVKLYLLPTQVTHLRGLEAMRFYFYCSQPICEDLLVSERALSVPDRDIRNRFKIYPNPAGDLLNLEYGNDVQVQDIQLVDVSGRVVKIYEGPEKVLQLKDVASGMYFLNIRAREGYVSERITIYR